MTKFTGPFEDVEVREPKVSRRQHELPPKRTLRQRADTLVPALAVLGYLIYKLVEFLEWQVSRG